MREILFRGMIVDSSEWICGFYNEYCQYIGHSGIGLRNVCLISNRYADNKLVYLDTIGQYTGRKDKNDKKIFEGDIVKRAGHIGTIIYKDGAFKIEWKSGVYYRRARPMFDYMPHSLCVVGNIHDNPELLEEEK